jgi:hypothetical protein
MIAGKQNILTHGNARERERAATIPVYAQFAFIA